jgi:hypothetical protein
MVTDGVDLYVVAGDLLGPSGNGSGYAPQIDVWPSISFVVDTTPPSPPTNVSVQTGLTTIALTWNTNPEADIAGYKLHYDTDAAGYPYANSVNLGNVTSYTLSSLTTGTTYYTAISAYDSDGNESLVSANATATTQSVPTTLAFSIQPSNAISGGTFSTQPILILKDIEGNMVTTASNSVTLSITPGTGTAGAIFSGTTTVNAVNGIATFVDLSIDAGGSGYTLTASSPGLTGTTSSSFAITIGTLSKLAFTIQPVGAGAGSSFNTQPVVVVQDNLGNTVTSSTSAVTLSITPGTGTAGATLSGTTTVNAVNGIATFTGLSIDKAGVPYTLTATSPDLTRSVSSTFAIPSFGAGTAMGRTTLFGLFLAFALLYVLLVRRKHHVSGRMYSSKIDDFVN